MRRGGSTDTTYTMSALRSPRTPRRPARRSASASTRYAASQRLIAPPLAPHFTGGAWAASVADMCGAIVISAIGSSTATSGVLRASASTPRHERSTSVGITTLSGRLRWRIVPWFEMNYAAERSKTQWPSRCGIIGTRRRRDAEDRDTAR